MKKLIIVQLLLTLVFYTQAQEMDVLWGETKNEFQRSNRDREKLFDDGNYGMFIHWGIYSNLAGQWEGTTYYGISEWIMSTFRADIAPKEYMALAKGFNPELFNADSIASLAKQAGMKYIVATSKHHDGFAMYDSKCNDFNIIKQTSWGRDPLMELSVACRKNGLGFGIYYSHNQDWTYPGGNRGPVTNEKGKEVGFDYYFKKKCLPQVKELTKSYGDIDIVWFDTPGEMDKKYVEELVEVVRKNQPNAMISGRAGHGLGDYQSLGDMHIPETNINGLWETVDVTNDSWGYAWYDRNWKTPKTILTSVLSTVARGGTIMMNIGPKGDGTVPERARYALENSGDWLIKYPEVINSAAPSPWKKALPWGDATVSKDGTINLLVYNWPIDQKIYLPGLKNEVSSVQLMTDQGATDLVYSKRNGWLEIETPAVRSEKLVSVIKMKVKGELAVEQTLGLDPDFQNAFPVELAASTNCSIEEKRWMEKFGEWKHVVQAQNWSDSSNVSWEVEILTPGYYQVDLNYAGKGRTVWKIGNGEDVIQNEQSASHIYIDFKMGQLNFSKPGKYVLTVSLLEGDFEFASLKSIKLKRADL